MKANHDILFGKKEEIKEPIVITFLFAVIVMSFSTESP
jgi:hypothetical protein